VSDIEKRLKALERRAQQGEENLRILNARIKAQSMIFTAIGLPICASIPSLSAQIIENLRNCEEVARSMNGRTALIREFREVRESLEGPAKR